MLEIRIDHVVYDFGDRMVRFYEVEVEHKGENNYDLSENVVRELLMSAPQLLKRWRFSKLATGKAIQNLSKEMLLDRFIDTNGNLISSAFLEIERILGCEPI